MKNRLRAAILAALTIGAFGVVSAQAQKLICLPQSFTSFQDSIGFAADGQLVTQRERHVFDLPNQRQRFDVYTQFGSKILQNESIIQDFKAGLQYDFNLSDKVCFTRKITGTLSQQCPASNAQLQGLERIISLTTERWSAVLGIGASVNVRLANTNIPTDTINRVSDGSLGIELFTDFVAKVNATDFTVPSYCVT